jgi:RHS repeat-associated protein
MHLDLNPRLCRRGYTGHAHLPWFKLINERQAYDPLTGRFLSPDNYIQLPGYTQNLNRYSYALNNPLLFTDPSGEVFGVDDVIITLAMAYFGGMQANFFTADNPFNPGEWDWRSPGTYVGIGSGILSGLGMAGVQIPTLFPNLDGIIIRGIYQAGVNVGLNGIGNLINGDPFFNNWEGVALSGLTNGTITGYQLADFNGKNLWWGSDIGYNRKKWSFFNWDVPDYTIDFGIPNVGSNLDLDCVPTTFTEVETKRGGVRTYDNFKKSTN